MPIVYLQPSDLSAVQAAQVLGHQAGARADVQDLGLSADFALQNARDLARGDVAPGGAKAFVIGLGPVAI